MRFLRPMCVVAGFTGLCLLIVHAGATTNHSTTEPRVVVRDDAATTTTLRARAPRAQSVPASRPTTTTLDPRDVEAVNRAAIVIQYAKDHPPTTTTTTTFVAATPTTVIGTAVQATSSSGGSACGGDLPPCYVCMRESHCTYGINTGNGYFGKWQFALDWGGKLGLPNPIWLATPAQEDEAARELWANGAGCSNWSACRG